MNFLKMRAGLITVTSDINAGIVCKINDAPIVAVNSELVSGYTESHYSTSGAIPVQAVFLIYAPSIVDLDLGSSAIMDNPAPPAPLDMNAEYFFGANNTSLAAYMSNLGQPLPEGFEGIEGEFVITLYPASKLPNANIDQDLFDYIIDPASYTQADLQYFADRGVTPAVKNPDGSYTIKSQLTMPNMG